MLSVGTLPFCKHILQGPAASRSWRHCRAPLASSWCAAAAGAELKRWQLRAPRRELPGGWSRARGGLRLRDAAGPERGDRCVDDPLPGPARGFASVPGRLRVPPLKWAGLRAVWAWQCWRYRVAVQPAAGLSSQTSRGNWGSRALREQLAVGTARWQQPRGVGPSAVRSTVSRACCGDPCPPCSASRSSRLWCCSFSRRETQVNAVLTNLFEFPRGAAGGALNSRLGPLPMPVPDCHISYSALLSTAVWTLWDLRVFFFKFSPVL